MASPNEEGSTPGKQDTGTQDTAVVESAAEDATNHTEEGPTAPPTPDVSEAPGEINTAAAANSAAVAEAGEGANTAGAVKANAAEAIAETNGADGEPSPPSHLGSPEMANEDCSSAPIPSERGPAAATSPSPDYASTSAGLIEQGTGGSSTATLLSEAKVAASVENTEGNPEKPEAKAAEPAAESKVQTQSPINVTAETGGGGGETGEQPKQPKQSKKKKRKKVDPSTMARPEAQNWSQADAIKAAADEAPGGWHEHALDTVTQFVLSRAGEMIEDAAELNEHGHFRAAAELLGRALEDVSGAKGRRHVLAAKAMLGLSQSLDGLGKFPAALALQRQALPVFLEAYGEAVNAEVAGARSSMGVTLGKLRRGGEGKAQLALAREAYTALFGDTDELVARSWKNLGQLLKRDGDFEAARAALNTALATYDAALVATLGETGAEGERGEKEVAEGEKGGAKGEGEAGPGKGGGEGQTAASPAAREAPSAGGGDGGAAEKTKDSAAAVGGGGSAQEKRKTVDRLQRAKAATLTTLASVLKKLGEFEASVEHHRRARAVYEGCASALAAEVAAAAALGAGRTGGCAAHWADEVKEWGEGGKVAARQQAHYVNAALSRHNLGNVLFEWGRFEEALSVYGTALRRLEALLGPDHPDTQLTRKLIRQAEKRLASALKRQAKQRAKADAKREARKQEQLERTQTHIALAEAAAKSAAASAAASAAHSERAHTHSQSSLSPPVSPAKALAGGGKEDGGKEEAGKKEEEGTRGEEQRGAEGSEKKITPQLLPGIGRPHADASAPETTKAVTEKAETAAGDVTTSSTELTLPGIGKPAN